jgi:DNA-binding HxlR family transcriptional regulator
MQADGIVERTDFKEIPPKVAYSVTSFGETLAEALKPLCAWGSIHQAEIEAMMRARGSISANAA